jgi:hypothetical protein
MALTEEKMQEATAKAKEYLEYSIFTLALMLNIDLVDLDETWTNPVPENPNSDLWNAHQCLYIQLQAYNKIA